MNNNFWYKDEEGRLCLKLVDSCWSYRVGEFFCVLDEDEEVREYVGVTVTAKYDHPITQMRFQERERWRGFLLNGVLCIKINGDHYLDLFNATIESCTADTVVCCVNIDLTPYEQATCAYRGHWCLTVKGLAFAYGTNRLWFPKNDQFILANETRILSEVEPIIKAIPDYSKRSTIGSMIMGQAFFAGDMLRVKSPQGAIELKTGDVFPNNGTYYTANLEIHINEK
jgi:hypothetical protein